MKKNLLLITIFSFYTVNLFAQKNATPSVWVFEGVINKNIPITMILERDGEEIFGNYFYNKYKKIIGLQGNVQRDGSFELFEAVSKDFSGIDGYVFEDWRQSGVFSGRYVGNSRLVGTWRDLVKVGEDFVHGKENYPFSLQRQNKIQYSPEDLKTKLLAFDSNVELQFFLFEHFNYLDWHNLYYGDEVWREVKELGKEDMKVEIQYKNLFGDDTEEAVVQIQFDNWVYYLTAYYLEDKRWRKIPGDINFAKSAAFEEPCAWDKPGEGYFYFSFEEALAPNEFVLVGRTYGGYCDGVSRGNEIDFYVWQVTPKGIQQLYQETENSYWYESPSPYPSELPIYNNFSFVAGPDSIFPKHLQKIGSVYSTGKESDEDGEKYETYEVVDEKVEYLDLTQK